MKKLIFIVLALFVVASGVALADPWISTPSTTSQITSYQMIADGGAPVAVLPHINQDGTVMFAFDLGPLNLSNGNHNITVQGFNTLWGLQTNIFPFEFSRPADLEDIPSIALSPADPRQ